MLLMDRAWSFYLPLGQQQWPCISVFVCLDLALPLFYSPASLRLGLSPAWSYSSDNFPAALSDPGSEPGTNTPLENAPDNLQGYLAANPFFNSGVSRHDF